MQDDAGKTSVSIKLKRPNSQPVEILSANIDDLFAVRFVKHDLLGNQQSPNWAYWGYVEYQPGASNPRIIPTIKDTVAFGAPAVALEYRGVGYVVDSANRPGDLPSYVRNLTEVVNAGTLGKMDVTVTISRAQNRTSNNGWINFDISHTYPPTGFPLEDSNAAWEERIIYPRLKFTGPDLRGFQPLTSLLGYSAFYKEQQFIDAYYGALGVALHVDDERGHHRETHFSDNQLSFQLLNSIHLKNTTGGKTFVRPPAYQLSGGDNYGFGGNVMLYRLRAFEIIGVREYVPVDWRDVLNIYRQWIRDRQPLFYRKYRTRATDGPLDQMAPATVINNFSPDGVVDVATNARLAAWLEQHPVKDKEPNVPNNPNESLLKLLSRLRSRFNTWYAWEDLGGGLKSGPAASSWGDNRIDCFVRGTDDRLHHKFFDGAWHDWQSLGGTLTSAPAAVSWGVNRIDCVARAADNSLQHKFFDGTWHEWVPLGDVLTSSPAIASWGPNRLDVLARGTDNALYHKIYDGGTWRNWAPVGGALTSSPAAIAWGPNRIICFVRGADNVIYQNIYNGSSWTSWQSLGKLPGTVQAASAPAVSSWGTNRLDLFVRGTDNAMWHRIWDGVWGSWERLGGGTFQDDLAAVSMRPERIDCFVRGVPNSTLKRFTSDLPTKLEAQIWDFEMAGLYRYYGGFPPMADVLGPARFKRAMDELADNKIIPIFTTDPLSPILNRKRFRGHLLSDGAGGWKPAIPHPFPNAVKNSTCSATDVSVRVYQDDTHYTDYPANRVWFVLNETSLYDGTKIKLTPEPKAIPSCTDAVTALASRRLDAFGRGPIFPPTAMGNGFYKSLQTKMCPTETIEDVYLDKWLKNGLFAYGARLIEFMKQSLYGGFCYNKNHQHIVPPDPADLPDPSEPPDPPTLPYTNVMGAGFWYIRRCRSIMRGVQRRGLEKYPAFSITTEFTPPEGMLPYVDECYSADPHTYFVYNNLMNPKIGPFTDWTLPPGYQEKRRNTLVRVAPTHMLSPDRDTEAQPTTVEERKVSFRNWRDACVNYFNANFTVSEYGLAARNYQTTIPGAPSVDNPATYSFCRGVQDMFNLRGRIFEVGVLALEGQRIFIASVYMEEPYDYNEEVINFASRAAQMQSRYKDFFRAGYILGVTNFNQTDKDNQPFSRPTVWAWGSHFRNARPFGDVKKVVEAVTAEDKYLGTEYRYLGMPNGSTFKIFDFISRPVDREIYYFEDTPGHFAELYRNEMVVFPRVPHLIWQHGEGTAARILYLFANISNSPVQVAFKYDKGLNVAPPGTNWTKMINVISGEGNSQSSGTVVLDTSEKQTIPPRSFMGVLLYR
jgi:hypothetical protein